MTKSMEGAEKLPDDADMQPEVMALGYLLGCHDAFLQAAAYSEIRSARQLPIDLIEQANYMKEYADELASPKLQRLFRDVCSVDFGKQIADLIKAIELKKNNGRPATSG